MTTTMTVISSETQHYKQGKHYIELNNPNEYLPPVVVYFSFLDPKSRDWALKYNIIHTIRKNVPSGTEIARYHSSQPWAKELGNGLNDAWAVARSLQVDDRVLKPLYDHIHETKISDLQGVKAAFDQIGIDPLKFDREFSKPSVQKETKWMDESREKLGITELPSLVVAGRYLVRPDAFGDDFHADRVADLVKELLEMK